MAPPGSGEITMTAAVMALVVCKHCGAAMRPGGGHKLRTLDDTHRAVPR